MKKIMIGRSLDCDIVIPDETDNVSRHHAVISFDFFGRMKLSDTSSNGTLINGLKMLKGASIPVTKNDKIQLGDAWLLDWNLVEDPYKAARRNAIIAAAVALVLAIAGITWMVYSSCNPTESPAIVVPKQSVHPGPDSWNKDSTNKVAPTQEGVKSATNPKKQAKAPKAKTRSKKTRKRNTEPEIRKTPHQQAEKQLTDKYKEKSDMPVVN
ncbi:MAG: FHA domain-containing protein [Sodaliphilus sp.]